MSAASGRFAARAECVGGASRRGRLTGRPVRKNGPDRTAARPQPTPRDAGEFDPTGKWLPESLRPRLDADSGDT
jgi:hypothetical protein